MSSTPASTHKVLGAGRYVVAVDLGTSGTAFSWRAREDKSDVNNVNLAVWAPGSLVTENQGKAPTAVTVRAEAPHDLLHVGQAALDEMRSKEDEELGHTCVWGVVGRG